ncbi:unnamed protein product [Microthlaspi erraticum]|uniref:Uncharacterized protein n=1 Tax=Microthlaspi erraticum TaxID=1685480 RepID=A0A6D2I5P8_9BRAS|nr:unnamed protein product [Microthlaspi erraticum]
MKMSTQQGDSLSRRPTIAEGRASAGWENMDPYVLVMIFEKCYPTFPELRASGVAQALVCRNWHVAYLEALRGAVYG